MSLGFLKSKGNTVVRGWTVPADPVNLLDTKEARKALSRANRVRKKLPYGCW